MDGFHLFTSLAAPCLLCAVPADQPIPSFIRAPAWAYVRKWTPDVIAGLNAPSLAQEKWAPFYLFEIRAAVATRGEGAIGRC